MVTNGTKVILGSSESKYKMLSKLYISLKSYFKSNPSGITTITLKSTSSQTCYLEHEYQPRIMIEFLLFNTYLC